MVVLKEDYDEGNHLYAADTLSAGDSGMNLISIQINNNEAVCRNIIWAAIMAEIEDGDTNQATIGPVYKNIMFAAADESNVKKDSDSNFAEIGTSKHSFSNSATANWIMHTEKVPASVSKAFVFADFTVLPLIDNFDDDSINGTLWAVEVGGDGDVSETNSQIEMTTGAG